MAYLGNKVGVLHPNPTPTPDQRQVEFQQWSPLLHVYEFQVITIDEIFCW